MGSRAENNMCHRSISVHLAVLTDKNSLCSVSVTDHCSLKKLSTTVQMCMAMAEHSMIATAA